MTDLNKRVLWGAVIAILCGALIALFIIMDDAFLFLGLFGGTIFFTALALFGVAVDRFLQTMKELLK